MVFADDMADDQSIHDVRLSYNRMASLLVFVANAFTLMYVGGMNPEDSIWYGLVSGSFTFAVLTNASLTPESMQEFKRSRSDHARNKSKPMGMPRSSMMMPQQMPPQQMPPQQMIPQQMIPQQQVPQQQPMQPMMKQQNFIPPDEDNEYVDPVTGVITPVQEAEMLD